MTGLDAAQLAAWDRDGFLVVPDAVDARRCQALIERAEQIVATYEPETVSVFTTHEQTRTSDDHFLASGEAVSCFFEEGAIGPDGTVHGDIATSINKIGHAQHDLDPVFDDFSRQPAIAEAAASVGIADPKLLQSMYIFKQPRIGGEVSCHQDATFLSTEPQSVVGFWVALQDATVDNGCLWAQPGGHRGPLRRRFAREPGGGTRFDTLDDAPLPAPGGPELVPLPVSAGTMVILHGLLPHWSGENHSPRSRHAYSIHVIDGGAHYPTDNWLQRPHLRLRGFAHG